LRFDAQKCRKGIEALKLIHTEWDQDKRVFKRKALHDWTSHATRLAADLAGMNYIIPMISNPIHIRTTSPNTHAMARSRATSSLTITPPHHRCP